MKDKRKLHMFLCILIAALMSLMLVLMHMGGSVNFQEFMSAGRVYDVEPVKLQMSSRGWLYESQNQGHRLQKNKAMIRFSASDTVQTWEYLYITVRWLSKEPLEGVLRYYDGEDSKVLEQPIMLTQGRNMIRLDSTIPMRIFGITIFDAKGEFISVSDIQIRTTPSWFTIPYFLKLFAVALAETLALLVVITSIYRLIRAQLPGGRYGLRGEWLLDSMQDVIRVFGNFLGKQMGGRLYPHQRESVRIFLFSLLFVWMMFGNIAGWLANTQMYRYHVLICALLLLAISFVSWERALQNQNWSGPLMVSWLCIWLGMILCDFFVVRKIESVTGYAMLIVGSVFLYFWQNMQRPDRMIRDMMEALEVTFFLSAAYCFFFRGKLPAVDYNGMFRSSEELAMYAVLMAVVFLTELDWALEGQKGFSSYVKNITGGAASLFFLLRSGHLPGILIFLLIGILYIPIFAGKLYRQTAKIRTFFCIIAAAIVAYACTCILFIGTKYVPQLLGMDVAYEEELLVTWLEGEQREQHLLQNPQSLLGVRSKQLANLPIIWRTYGRRLNLFGHSGGQKVFRRDIAPYSGYLGMAYQQGLFILLPYVLFQVLVVVLGMKCLLQKCSGKNVFLFFLGITYLCFCFCANTERCWGHPLWLCYYLSAGYLGRMEKGKD